jgi:hypothetical protein
MFAENTFELGVEHDAQASGFWHGISNVIATMKCLPRELFYGSTAMGSRRI